jgi:hypothetical protein
MLRALVISAPLICNQFIPPGQVSCLRRMDICPAIGVADRALGEFAGLFY